MNPDPAQLSLFTKDEDLDALQGRDLSVEVVGYVEEVTATRAVRGGKFRIFKFVLSNGNRKLRCIIWGPLIDLYERQIISRRILHIDGAQGAVPDPKWFVPAEGLLNYELTIQNSTGIDYLGFYGPAQQPDAVQPRVVDFNTIPTSGLIEIEAYVKTEFRVAIGRNGASSFGIGAIGDGVFKMTVQITSFVVCHILKTMPVRIVGTVTQRDGSVFILCPNLDSISAIEGRDPIDALTLRNGNKQPTLINYELPPGEEENNPPVQQNDDLLPAPDNQLAAQNVNAILVPDHVPEVNVGVPEPALDVSSGLRTGKRNQKNSTNNDESGKAKKAKHSSSSDSSESDE